MKSSDTLAGMAEKKMDFVSFCPCLFFIPPSGAIKTFPESVTATPVKFGAGLMAASSAEMTLFSF